MKNDILEGFSLALLTQLNAYSIISKGKGMFSEKKPTHPKHKNTPQNPNKRHTFLQTIYGEIGCSAQTCYRDRVVCVYKSKILPRTLILI